ncbi:ABC transporter ATP-binding protein [Demequina activiva]|uniref:ABC transporter ATP-binding protein n=1 Tax=Demequina activiva TaxID=1582364 RepID=A0A919PZS5_9MICO|nr:ABC transporter ATP-binding protein [Demequina activiva]GIG53452.1 ABC transporter ATP-binding protein [Demequina activiva]
MADPIITASGLTKSFGATAALRGIDLEVARGEVVAVMGPSGSGKSTLIHCLAGVLAPDTGSVAVDGTELTALSADARARFRLERIGFVFQFGQLLPDLTAVENVALPLLMAGARRRDANERSLQWLDRLDLADQAGKSPGDMSGGQAQRVAIARALAPQPSVVFADEPTGSLDSVAAENVLTAMLDVVRESGTTVVLITHDARTAAHADREVIVRDGLLSGTAPVGAR